MLQRLEGKTRVVVLLLFAWFVLPALSTSAPSLLALLAVALAAGAALGRVPVWGAAASGLLALAMAFVAPTQWGVTFFALVATSVAAEALVLPRRRASHLAWALTLVGPALTMLLLHLGGEGALASGALRALAPAPAGGAVLFGLSALKALAGLALLAEAIAPVQAPAAAPARAARLVLALAVSLAGARIASVLAQSSFDAELFWTEAPFLVNATKLARGATLYGPAEELASYSYSPLLDLTHRLLLAPLGRALDLSAHRSLELVAQAGAAAIAGAALLRRRPVSQSAPVSRSFGVAASLVVLFAAFGSLLAATVHPDHMLGLFFAVAMALVVAPPRSAPLRLALLFLVTPLAFATKLSGAGIGVGLGLWALFRRDRRDVVVLVASGAVALLTIPLFNRSLGDFTGYAIALQKAHPIHLAQLGLPPWPSYALFLAVAGAFAAWSWSALDAPDRSRLGGILTLTVSMGLASLPAAAKYAGRENNAQPLYFGLSVALVFLAVVAPRRAVAALALALWGGLVTRPPTTFPTATARALAAQETDAVAAIVRDDAARGESTLVAPMVLPYLRAGVTDFARDRYASANEFFLARRPEADVLLAHVRDGRYRTIVVGNDLLAPRQGPAAAFSRRFIDAVESRYERRESSLASARIYVRR
ncbi:MAG: hypothetical protein IPG50_16950 [Myxococcales bacterium]|nr:hypothetical protein [Myxococcales bacterium]